MSNRRDDKPRGYYLDPQTRVSPPKHAFYIPGDVVECVQGWHSHNPLLQTHILGQRYKLLAYLESLDYVSLEGGNGWNQGARFAPIVRMYFR